jgi:hypothetical protein
MIFLLNGNFYWSLLEKFLAAIFKIAQIPEQKNIHVFKKIALSLAT